MALLNPHLEASTIAEFQGDVIRRSDPRDDEGRAVWNGMIDENPAPVARCIGVGDVVRAVSFGREHDLLVALRGSGHNVAGTAVCDDGICIT